MTVPVHCKGFPRITDVDIVHDGWHKKHLKTLRQLYGRAPHWSEHGPYLETVYGQPWTHLSSLNIVLSRWLMTAFGIHTPIRYSATMEPEGEKSALVLNLCKQVGASTYLSGPHGKDYLDEEAFGDAGIAVEYHSHPPGISAIDRLMRRG